FAGRALVCPLAVSCGHTCAHHVIVAVTSVTKTSSGDLRVLLMAVMSWLYCNGHAIRENKLTSHSDAPSNTCQRFSALPEVIRFWDSSVPKLGRSQSQTLTRQAEHSLRARRILSVC